MKLPPEPSSCDSYDLWRQDIEVWAELTETPVAKRGLALQYACRTNKRLHKAVLKIPSEQVKCNEGLENVLKVIDTFHKVDKKESAVKSYKEFLSLKRKQDQTIADFILEFDEISNETKSNGNSLSDDLLAYQLLESVNISETDVRVIRTSTVQLTYKNVQDALRRSFGDSTYSTQSIKPEPVFVNNAEDQQQNESEDEVFYGASNKWRNFRQNSNRNNDEHQTYQLSMRQTTRRGKNPFDKNGHITQCNYCCSINHYAPECPDKRKDSSATNSNAYYNVTLYEQDEEDPDNMRSLIHETFGCAVLDCGAPRTVCGENWMNNFMGTLKEEDYELVKYSKSNSVFKFGNGKCIKAINSVQIPISIGTKNVTLTTEVITEDIPLLFSRNSMKKAKARLNTADDTISMLGEEIKLVITSTGHYAVPINRNRNILEQEANISLQCSIPNMSQEQIALKLHRQFAHQPPERLIKLIEKSHYKNDNLITKIEEVSNSCDICKKYQKQSLKPAVYRPMAKRFNDIVAIDIKYIKDQPVLHLIDCQTRFSTSTIVPDNKAETLISSIFKIWIAVFGTPANLISNNETYFANEKFVSMGKEYNIYVKTTVPESAWSNYICNRYNSILGEMAERLIEDTGCSLTVALAWTNSAKNAMQTIQGFSPAQLVFGYNPMLPTVNSDKPPALSSESAYTDLVEGNLNALRMARIAHVQTESSERLRRAQNKDIISRDIKYIDGDSVYFRKNRDNTWEGPACVVGQDGQLVLVTLQNTWFRIHTSNLQLINKPESSIETIKDFVTSITNPNKKKDYEKVVIDDDNSESESEDENLRRNSNDKFFRQDNDQVNIEVKGGRSRKEHDIHQPNEKEHRHDNALDNLSDIETLVTQTFFNQWTQQVTDEKKNYEKQKPKGLKQMINSKFVKSNPGCKANLVCKDCRETKTSKKESTNYSKPAKGLSLVFIAGLLLLFLGVFGGNTYIDLNYSLETSANTLVNERRLTVAAYLGNLMGPMKVFRKEHLPNHDRISLDLARRRLEQEVIRRLLLKCLLLKEKDGSCWRITTVFKELNLKLKRKGGELLECIYIYF